MTFKKLVYRISEIETEEDAHIVCGEINKSFEHEHITYSDLNILYHMAWRMVKEGGG